MFSMMIDFHFCSITMNNKIIYVLVKQFLCLCCDVSIIVSNNPSQPAISVCACSKSGT